ncbi:MAG: nucleotidyltransferase domain-containing protein [bacterium]
MKSVSKGTVLKRNSRLQAEKGSSADGRTVPNVTLSILQTLKYSDHFDFPLTASEIYTRLIEIKASRSQIEATLSELCRSKKIGKTKNSYHLPHRETLVSRRLKCAKLSKPLLARARKLSSKISHLKSILAIYLTGSLAVGNTDRDSDIDLMIITKPGRLWTTRLLLTLYTTLLNLRRTPHSLNNSGKLCLNLYLTPNAYLLPPDRRSLYTAYELIQAVPLHDPMDTHSALLSANSWIHNYLPNAITGSDLEGSAQPRPYSERGRSDPIGNLLESLVYHLQFLYMRPRITREYVTKDSAFFHPHNPGEIVINKLSRLI